MNSTNLVHLKDALRTAALQFLRQVEDHNVIPKTNYYATDCGHVYYKTWLGFLIPEDMYVSPMEKRSLWPTFTEKKNAVWEVIVATIIEAHNSDTVDGLHPCQILSMLQACYNTAAKEDAGVTGIQAEVDAAIKRGNLPHWCTALLSKDEENWRKYL